MYIMKNETNGLPCVVGMLLENSKMNELFIFFINSGQIWSKNMDVGSKKAFWVLKMG